MAEHVRWIEAPLPCPWCVLLERHAHSLRDDDTLGIVVRPLAAVSEGTTTSESDGVNG